MIGSHICGSYRFKIDYDEDGEWRVICALCQNIVYDSHDGSFPDIEFEEEDE